MNDFIANYLEYNIDLLTLLPVFPIKEAINLLKKVSKGKGMIYVCGNGGSFAIASHLVADLNRLNLCKAICLPSTTEELTMWANDTGYENIFSNSLKKYINPKDLLVVISSSGNSRNVIEAAKLAKNKIPIIALVGFDGGELIKLADIKIHVKTKKGEYGLVEGIHSVIHHLIIECLKF